MSVEVTDQKFHFQQGSSLNSSFQPPPWRHNILHDLDSVWWISIWATFSFINKQTHPSQADKQRFHGLFPVSGSSLANRLAVSRTSESREHAPSYNRSIWIILDQWRRELTRSFVQSEAKFFSGSDAQPTLEMCLNAFTDAISQIQSVLALSSDILDAPVACQPP